MTVTHRPEVDMTDRSPILERIGFAGRAHRAVVVCKAEPPFSIVAVNTEWSSLCGYSAAEALGCTTKLLQGSLTNYEKASKLAADLQANGQARTTLINYTKSGCAFVHKLACDLVVTKDGSSYYLTESEEVKDASVVAAIFENQRERLSRVRVLTWHWFFLYAALLFCCFAVVVPALFEQPEATVIEVRPVQPHAKHFSRFFAPLGSIELTSGWPPLLVA